MTDVRLEVDRVVHIHHNGGKSAGDHLMDLDYLTKVPPPRPYPGRARAWIVFEGGGR